MYATIVRSSHQRCSIEKAVLKNFAIFFCYYGILSQTMIIHRAAQQGTGGDHVLFLSATSISSRKFRHLFVTLYVKWLPRIFNRIAFNYQNATRWDLPPYRITIWLTDNAMLTSICLLDDLVLGFSDSSLTRQNGGFELTSVITLYYKQIASHFLSSHSMTPPVVFRKNVSSKERVKPCFFMTFNIIIRHIFPENFIEIPQVV